MFGSYLDLFFLILVHNLTPIAGKHLSYSSVISSVPLNLPPKLYGIFII